MAELIERSAQLEALAVHWQSVVSTGIGCVVAIGGEAGVGKTALVRAFCASAAHGPRILSGACEALFTPRPLGPFLDIARELEGADSILKDARPYDIASFILADIAARGPAIVVLEDLHWADEATLDVMWLLARRVETQPLLVLATYRDDEIDRSHPLRVLLGEMSGRLARLQIPVLSAEAVDLLAVPSGVDGEELYRKTGGNPFFVTEVLSAPESAIPDSVRDAVLARVTRLGAAAREVLEVVAIVPSHAELPFIEALAPGSGAGLEQCLDAGVLVGGREGVAFRHELARVAVNDSLPMNRHRELHQLALAALAAEPSGTIDLARLSHHASAAGDSPAVVVYAPAAAREAAALGAHREAVAHYAQALGHAQGLAPETRGTLYAAHAWECYLSGSGAEAIASAGSAVATYREDGDERAVADALVRLSHIQRIEGRIVEAEHSIASALAILEALPPGRELASALASAARAAMSDSDVERMYRAGNRALELAEQFDAHDVLVDVLITIGTVEIETRGGTEESREKLERSIRLARDAGLEELAGRAYNSLIYEALTHSQLDLAKRVIDEAVEYATQRGLDLRLQCTLGLRAALRLAQGDWAAAVDDAVTVLGRVRTGVARIDALVVLGTVRARRGDPDVWGPLDEALAIAKGTDALWIVFPVIAARAEANWLAEMPEAILPDSEPFVSRAFRSADRWALSDLAYWRREAGAVERIVDDDRSPRRLQMNGQPRAAAEAWAALGYPYEAALALADTGEPQALREALEGLRALGALATVAAVARRARAAGAAGVPRGPRASTAANPAQLTSRELEVLELLAMGLRNAEIAEKLFLSTKTVGHHVSAVLRKLGVRTRGQAVVAAARLGLSDTAPR